jgi:hypothetical protein
MLITQTQPTWRQLPRQQQRFFLPGCACCPTECVCSDSGPFPTTLTLTISGVTNNSCTHCSDAFYTGAITLTKFNIGIFANLCVYKSSQLDDGCGGGGAKNQWQAVFTGGPGGSLTVSPIDSGPATFILSSGADCLASNTVPLSDSGTGTCNWPSSVTVAP